MLRSLLASLLILAAPAAPADAIRVLTSRDLAPMARGPEAEPPGFHHELITLLAERAGLELELVYEPWERAQNTATGEPGTMLLALTRNAAREPLYEWVLPVLEVRQVFLTTRRPVNGIEAARGLGTIAAQNLYHQMLEAEGFDNLVDTETETALRMLAAGRVEAVFTLRERAVCLWAELGLPPEELVIGAPIAKVELWLAATPGGDRDVARRLRAASAALHADGTYEALRARYFGAG